MIESRSVVAWSEEWGGRARGNFWVWYVHYLSYGDCLMAIHIWQNLLYTLNIYSLLYLYLNKTVFKKAGFSFPLSLQIRSSNYTNKRVPPYILISFSITFFKLFVGKIQSTFLDHSWTKQNIFYFKKSSYKVSAKVT